MTYEQTLERIHAFPRFGGSPGVERVRKLLAQLGNPQDRWKYIHVAGTNGKGSTCAMIASVLQKAGYRTGLFTSPFLSDFCERIRVDAEKIPRESLVEITEEVLPVAQGLIENGEALTEFDFTTALGFLWFARQQCDFVVLEVGLGGRNDATNVIGTPLVSVITSISLDHTSVLGDTVEQIAAEKAGIIKPYGVTVAYGDQLPGAMEVIRRAAMKQHNRLVEAAPSAQLIANIFFNKAPLHDGGMIIREGQVYAAGCILPLTSNENVSAELGTRHRAALGMSENSDAVVVVVSEETGQISIAMEGKLTRNYNRVTLREVLESALIGSPEETTGSKRILGKLGFGSGTARRGE